MLSRDHNILWLPESNGYPTARELIGRVRSRIRGVGVPRLHHAPAPCAVGLGHLETSCLVDGLAGSLQFWGTCIGVDGLPPPAGCDHDHRGEGDDHTRAGFPGQVFPRDVKQALFNYQNLSSSLVEGLESGGDRPPSTIFARPVIQG